MKQSEFVKAANEVAPMLFTHAMTFTKDEDDAKDLVQDTMLKGIRFCKGFDPKTNVKSWLYVIMRNTFINSYRKEKRKKEVITADSEISNQNLIHSASSNTSNSSFALADIGKALNSLPEIYRVPFQRYFEGYKYEEVANELGIPLGTVKTRIFQAREHLKQFLKLYRPGAH